MTIDYAGKSKAVLTYLKVMLDGVTGTQPDAPSTYIGIPESIAAKVTASVSMGDRDPVDKMVGYHETHMNFFVEFAYRVKGAEATAETTLADWLDAFEEAWLADRNLGGLVRTSSLDFSQAAEPTYRPVAGTEFRVFPVVVRTTVPR